MLIIRSQEFTSSLHRLHSGDGNLFVEVAADIRYLLRRRRSACLPQVRFGLSQSRYSSVMGEVRSHVHGDTEFIRTLFALPIDESVCALLVMGDKNATGENDRTGNAWYDQAVPLADMIWGRILDSGVIRAQGRDT